MLLYNKDLKIKLYTFNKYTYDVVIWGNCQTFIIIFLLLTMLFTSSADEQGGCRGIEEDVLWQI